MQKTKLFVAIAAAAGLGWGTMAQAGPVVGLDLTGTGNFTNAIYADLWTDITDTGIDVKESGAGGNNDFAPGDVHSFHTQLRVGTMTLDGTPVTPGNMNVDFQNVTIPNVGTFQIPGFELTKEISFNDQVKSFDPTTDVNGNVIGGTVTFEHLADNYNNLTIYFDNLAGDGSRAIPGSGANTVRCYGSGGGGNPCPGPDGTPILRGNLISNTSSFTASAFGVGTGSFDLLFEITYFDPNYLDLSNLPVNGGTGNPIFAQRITGTLTQPLGAGVPSPAMAWDGTTAARNTIFKIDSSESYADRPIPEPGSLALLSIGLLGLSRFSLRKKHNS